MRGVEVNETDDEIAEICANNEHAGHDKVRFSPSAPVSPSWREGLDSPPFSPRRRDSYPGKRRGSSPVSPKINGLRTRTSPLPPGHCPLKNCTIKTQWQRSLINPWSPNSQRPSPKSPDEMCDSFYSNSDELLTFERPTSSLKKSKPFIP